MTKKNYKTTDIIKLRPLRRRQNKKTFDNHSLMLVSLAYTHAQDSLGNVITRTTIVILQQSSTNIIVNHLQHHHLLPNSQFGFCRGRGTADIVAALQYEWVRAFGHGGCAQVLAVDIAGAFDRVSHIGLLHKAQAAGIKGELQSKIMS